MKSIIPIDTNNFQTYLFDPSIDRSDANSYQTPYHNGCGY